jgi:hypothetical protein
MPVGGNRRPSRSRPTPRGGFYYLPPHQMGYVPAVHPAAYVYPPQPSGTLYSPPLPPQGGTSLPFHAVAASSAYEAPTQFGSVVWMPQPVAHNPFLNQSTTAATNDRLAATGPATGEAAMAVSAPAAQPEDVLLSIDEA